MNRETTSEGDGMGYTHYFERRVADEPEGAYDELVEAAERVVRVAAATGAGVALTRIDGGFRVDASGPSE
jgi:hypothetical protein